MKKTMHSISEESLVKLRETIKALQETGEIIERVLEKFNAKESELFTFTMLNFLERFNSTVQSVETLLGVLTERPSVETSIGLIIRSSLVDFMSITYLTSYQADIRSKGDANDQKFEEKLYAIHADQLRFTFKYFKDARNGNLISHADYKTAIENMRSNYPFLFNSDPVDYDWPEKQLVDSFISTSDMFKRINSHPFTKRFAPVYDNYQWYSKYEHFGVLTHFMQRVEINDLLNTLWVSIKYFNVGIGAALAYLDNPKEPLAAEMHKFTSLMDRYNLNI